MVYDRVQGKSAIVKERVLGYPQGYQPLTKCPISTVRILCLIEH